MSFYNLNLFLNDAFTVLTHLVVIWSCKEEISMLLVMRSIHHMKHLIDFKLFQFVNRHPHLAMLFAVVAAPAAILTAVFLFVMIFILPLAYVCGWM